MSFVFVLGLSSTGIEQTWKQIALYTTELGASLSVAAAERAEYC